MLKMNSNEFEMNGIKYKLKVANFEIESMLSLVSDSASAQTNKEGQRLLTDGGRGLKEKKVVISAGGGNVA